MCSERTRPALSASTAAGRGSGLWRSADGRSKERARERAGTDQHGTERRRTERNGSHRKRVIPSSGRCWWKAWETSAVQVQPEHLRPSSPLPAGAPAPGGGGWLHRDHQGPPRTVRDLQGPSETARPPARDSYSRHQPHPVPGAVMDSRAGETEPVPVTSDCEPAADCGRGQRCILCRLVRPDVSRRRRACVRAGTSGGDRTARGSSGRGQVRA